MSDKKVTYESEMNRLNELEKAWAILEAHGDTKELREEARVNLMGIDIMKSAMVNPRE